MNLLTELYNTYNQALEQGLVDKHPDNQTVILPLYHNNMKSNGTNIIRIILNTDSSLARVEFVPKDEMIIFPVNEDSVARSGSNPPSHPLVDKLDYITPSDDPKHEKFIDSFSGWYNFLENGESKEYLRIIKKFIMNKDVLEKIIAKLFEGINYKLTDYNFEYEDNSGKKVVVRKLDLSKIFLTYSINEFNGPINISVTKNINLHDSYIDYVEANLVSNGMCGITGEYTYISSKHRGLLGNAKLVSVSNNRETYMGRFNSKEDVFNMGYQTSEKIHLMLKYFLENKNSSKWLSEQQYLINWLSSDIQNDSQLDVMASVPLNLFGEEAEENEETNFIPVTLRNSEIGKSIHQGKITFSKRDDYNVAIIDKSSNGRLSVKYFRKMKASQLLTNLENWHLNNSWERYNLNLKKTENKTPSVYEIIMASHAIEREGRFVLDNGNFSKNLYQQLVKCIIDGSSVPKNYLVNLDLNIRQRMRYPNRWVNLMHVACSLLNNEKEGTFTTMVDKKSTDRSYLYGRLLAIYDLMESRTYERDDRRVTNAIKFWSSYTNNPENIMQTLEEKTKSYERKLMISNPGLYFKLQREKQEILTKLDENRVESDANKRLDYQFIFGYYSENKFIFTKQEEEIEHVK